MQEEKENMVDIDTSGPGADVELPEEKLENEIETKEDSSSAPQESTDKTVEASDEKPEAKEQKEELQDYSKDVQRRIAKLTKKWREAERQREDALTFARIQKDKAEELSKKYETELGYIEQVNAEQDARKAKIEETTLALDNYTTTVAQANLAEIMSTKTPELLEKFREQIKKLQVPMIRLNEIIAGNDKSVGLFGAFQALHDVINYGTNVVVPGAITVLPASVIRAVVNP